MSGYRFPPRLGKMRCCKCRTIFVVRAGPHATSHCPKCASPYYEWLDYEPIETGERTARGAAAVGSG